MDSEAGKAATPRLEPAFKITSRLVPRPKGSQSMAARQGELWNNCTNAIL